jgi:hypothetical protein
MPAEWVPALRSSGKLRAMSAETMAGGAFGLVTRRDEHVRAPSANASGHPTAALQDVLGRRRRLEERVTDLAPALGAAAVAVGLTHRPGTVEGAVAPQW